MRKRIAMIMTMAMRHYYCGVKSLLQNLQQLRKIKEEENLQIKN
jgi:hypothetical protein